MAYLTEFQQRIIAAIKDVGKYNRISNRYEFMITDLSSHKTMKQVRNDKLMSAVDALMRRYVFKLIGYNKYSCDASAMENTDES